MTYIFDTCLWNGDTGVDVTRQVQISPTEKLSELAYLLLSVYGAQGEHLFEIATGGKRYACACDEEAEDFAGNITIEEAFGRQKTAEMTYDYGDDWTIAIKRVRQTDEITIPKLLSGTGRGIIEDIGGVYGLADLIEAYREGKGKKYEQYRKWLGIEEYDAETCKVDRINERLLNTMARFAAIYEESREPKTTKVFTKWVWDCFGLVYYG